MSDNVNEFLEAVEELRGDDAEVRTTAHTSSVSAAGWPNADQLTETPES